MDSDQEWAMEEFLEAKKYGRPTSQLGTHVCSQCVVVKGLFEYVETNANHEHPCSFCEGDGTIPFDMLTSYMYGCIYKEWWIDSLSCNEDGIDTYTLFTEHLHIDSMKSLLYSLIYKSFGDHWWIRSGTSINMWHAFSRSVKHSCRYMFQGKRHIADPMDIDTIDDDNEWISPDRCLELIGKMIDQCPCMCYKLEASTVIYRARFGTGPFTSVDDLGPPPEKKCNKANRMSPAGISMLYGALDPLTCVRETYNHNPVCSVGEFMACKCMYLLDLTHISLVPSIFEPNPLQRKELLFLEDFARKVAEPLIYGANEHIDYVPTQVFAEYIRHVYCFPKETIGYDSDNASGHYCNGIIYNSSINDSGICVVLFLSDLQLIEKETYDAAPERYEKDIFDRYLFPISLLLKRVTHPEIIVDINPG